uniref:Isopenicillin N synthase-like Fe(2+) 2OG dioxygenase domain-containing protein n=1 Tax=Aegilops tauschii subsp. strangulata TaxID=200361 RepID=A0A453BG20_AEGTS
MQSLAQYSAAIIQLPPADAALLRSGLVSARLFFHQRVYDSVGDVVHSDDAREWKTSGYYADPQMWLEMYDYKPGVTIREHGGAMELSPSGLPDIFSMLGKVCRDILDAVSFSLNLRSCVFTEIFDNMPLRSQEVSSSVLSACGHSRPSFEEAQQHGIASHDDSQLLMFSEQEQQIDKTLLTLVKSDRSGLYIKDFHGRWILVDGDLGPHDIVVYPGLALYQETSGYVNRAVHKTEVGNLQGCMFGRLSSHRDLLLGLVVQRWELLVMVLILSFRSP